MDWENVKIFPTLNLNITKDWFRKWFISRRTRKWLM